jgi:hypothetical protein
MLPGDRLAKFQALMLPWIEREIIVARLLDIERVLGMTRMRYQI